MSVFVAASSGERSRSAPKSRADQVDEVHDDGQPADGAAERLDHVVGAPTTRRPASNAADGIVPAAAIGPTADSNYLRTQAKAAPHACPSTRSCLAHLQRTH